METHASRTALLLVALSGAFLLLFALAIVVVILFLIPSLGPSLIPSVVSALTSVALTYFAAVTIREGRRKSRSDLVFKKFEQLYSPLFHVVEESGGHIFEVYQAPARVISISEILTFWDNRVVPLMRQALHLASAELVEVYWRVTRSEERSEALATEFSDRVRSDYNRLMMELRRMDTKH